MTGSDVRLRCCICLGQWYGLFKATYHGTPVFESGSEPGKFDKYSAAMRTVSKMKPSQRCLSINDDSISEYNILYRCNAESITKCNGAVRIAMEWKIGRAEWSPQNSAKSIVMRTLQVFMGRILYTWRGATPAPRRRFPKVGRCPGELLRPGVMSRNSFDEN